MLSFYFVVKAEALCCLGGRLSCKVLWETPERLKLVPMNSELLLSWVSVAETRIVDLQLEYCWSEPIPPRAWISQTPRDTQPPTKPGL